MADEEYELEARPFAEAVEFFRAKGLKPGFDYRDVWQAEHQRSFTVAKAMTTDLLMDIRNSVDKAIADGISFEDFRDNLEPVLRARGWWGRQEMTDPLTGRKRQVQLGSVNRLRIIYDTNLRTSYSEGRWRQLQAVKADRPYVEYVDPDPNPRPTHLGWSGTVVRANDPWASQHWPPLDYNCKCEMNTLSEDDVAREGLGIQTPPTITREYVNPRNGRSYQVPEGVHPSFAYPPGRAQEAADNALDEKLAASDPDIRTAVEKIKEPPSGPTPEQEIDALWTDPGVDPALKRKRNRLPDGDPLRMLPPEEFGEINRYTGHQYDEYNRSLREGQAPGARTKRLADALEKLPGYDGVAYRGERWNPDEVDRRFPDVGQTVELDAGFLSATLSRAVAVRRFSTTSQIRTILTIKSKSGREIWRISKFPSEREVLFKPNRSFKVISKRRVVRQGSQFLYVTLEEE